MKSVSLRNKFFNMRIFNFFWWNITEKIGLIIRNETQSKKELFFTYLKLKLKYLFLIKILKLPIYKEKVFGYTIRFFDYQCFIFLFEEIFISKTYYFNAKTKNPIILDCGSNIGMTLIYFKKLYPKSKIIAFEPDNETFMMLKKNVTMNNLKDVSLFNKAVYNSDGFIDFYYDSDNPGSGLMGTTKDRLPMTLSAHSRVHSVLLSNFVKKPVDFLKMDIEGAENLVMEDLSSHKKLKLIKEICIEYHHHIKQKYDVLSKILKILEDNGFGYQINAPLRPPFNKETFQGMLIYAYKK